MTSPTAGTASAAVSAESVFARIRRARIVPVVRVRNAAAALDLVDRLTEAGLDVIELTTTIEGWDDAVRATTARHPDVCVGAGTVTTPRLALQAVAAGARFCVSPCLVPEVRDQLRGTDVPLIEGGTTPTEILGAAQHGVAKLFPAHLGGVAYLRSLLAVAPDARIMPTGGIPLTDVGAWLDAGAFAVGVGSDLTATGDIAARVREVLDR
ncbi:bifunctional 4-hydroxy-2-oxoglutarate aldolase/2-dehydro-3-deoxy-phosphogluconate aldolase [Streptomyces sporangiiformans]|uniref:Bifunctional 4-hydroxy-2-oxoglutarate aldolase/2-dehydro-3-deoxy-phosphogluconate aldolase n=1 Tax=Streptomyces sporangiiformans TaxID=2315329 RepID=A0A505DR93_9ACTN|nr:bifunctional 4-hydroxy-2-oxoglutarate aldolase/2-dehydro-3-deoxy-phosphogluconate aldolase [Streptomyces sporangiiformans]TPQ23821.1 bifunctional 4-hydroxy-2-oxoglutarate aldolase/2-dehydro-3-deoxy-phosphogluconate aldolase [Streptomyces sporangiiformans]